MEKALFGAGCFWGVEDAFQKLDGVSDAVSGYSGGSVANPSYEQVCTGRTGHAEVVEVTFDPERISYEQLLEVFWKIHDPTQVNRQGVDVGTQYRSAIFYLNNAQKNAAEASKQQLEASGRLPRPVATEVSQAAEFYPAEDYHQDYFEKRGGGACGVQ